MKQMLPQENFTVWTGDNFVSVEIRYRKGTETEKIDWTFNVGGAVEVIPEEWRQTPKPDDPDWKKPIAHARAAIVFPQILGVILLLICVIVMSYFVIEIRAKRSR